MIRRPSYSQYLSQTNSKSRIYPPENYQLEKNHLMSSDQNYQQENLSVTRKIENLRAQIDSQSYLNTKISSNSTNRKSSNNYLNSTITSNYTASSSKNKTSSICPRNRSFVQLSSSSYKRDETENNDKKQYRASVFGPSKQIPRQLKLTQNQSQCQNNYSRQELGIDRQKTPTKSKQQQGLQKSKYRRNFINYDKKSNNDNLNKSVNLTIKDQEITKINIYVTPPSQTIQDREVDLAKSKIRKIRQSSVSPLKIKQNRINYTPIKSKQRFSDEQKNCKEAVSPVQVIKSSIINGITIPIKADQSTFNKKIESLNRKTQRKLGIEDFAIGKQLGQGRFGTVYMAFHKNTGSIFALKKISKQTIKSNLMADQFLLEIKIQSYLQNTLILKIYGLFDDKQNIYLLLQYLQGGSLYQLLKRNSKHKLCEAETSQKIEMICRAVDVLHTKGIAHRDIKPENIIITNGVCKLGDFGWATVCDQRRKTYCGTTDYVAPQIVEGLEYDASVDLWCIGVLTYELLAGKAPFYHISRQQTFNKIKNVEDSSIVYPQYFSKQAIDFIANLIRKDPLKRMSMAEALEHTFIKNFK